MSNATSTPNKNNWVLMDHIFIALRKAELLVDNGAEGRGSDEIYLPIRQEVYRERPGGGPDAEFRRRAVETLAERSIIPSHEAGRTLTLLADPSIGEMVYGNQPGEPRPPGTSHDDKRMSQSLAQRLMHQGLLRYSLGYSGATWDYMLHQDTLVRARGVILAAVREDRERAGPDEVWADNLACWLEEGGVIRPGITYDAAAEALKEAFRQAAKPA